MRLFKIFIFIAVLSGLNNACTQDEEPTTFTGDYMTIKVALPIDESVTRVAVTPDDEGLDLIPFWENGDKMDFYAIHENEVIVVDGAPVTPRKEIVYLGSFEAKNITVKEKKPSCEFHVTYPEEVGKWKSFQLIGLYGKNAQVIDEKIMVDASVVRTTIPGFKVPLWFRVDIDGSPQLATCRHIGAYEVVHISNKADKAISFKLNGYLSYKKWYYEGATFYPEYWAYTQEVLVGRTPYDVSPIVRVKPGETGSLISWYVPSNDKFEDVTMEAFIDNELVQSSNTKSSQISFSTGYAYHLFVTWDGEKLTFDNGDIVFSKKGLFINNMGGEDL